ncbi:MAG: cytochrome b [Magnetococcus sp. DMHC-6]
MTTPSPTPPQRYDRITRWLHGGMAIYLFGMIGLGFYATSLGYYDPLYHRATDWHRSFGFFIWMLFFVRLGWRITHPAPPFSPNLSQWERRAARLTHAGLYMLLFIIPIAGYLLSTADGRGIQIFDWFTLPALLPAAKGRETLAGAAHLWLTIFFICLILLHLMAALKHHFIDRDGILRRIW